MSDEAYEAFMQANYDDGKPVNLRTYTIHEEILYSVDAASPAEAMKLFREDKNNAYLETVQLYITDHYGEERDEEDVEP